MKAGEYVKSGLKNFVEEIPPTYENLGSAKEGCHRVEFYGRVENGVLKDVKYNSSKRCKKLLAIADLVAEKLKGQKVDNFKFNDDDILEFFDEKKDKKKMEDRLSIIKKALNI